PGDLHRTAYQFLSALFVSSRTQKNVFILGLSYQHGHRCPHNSAPRGTKVYRKFSLPPFDAFAHEAQPVAGFWRVLNSYYMLRGELIIGRVPVVLDGQHQLVVNGDVDVDLTSRAMFDRIMHRFC